MKFKLPGDRSGRLWFSYPTGRVQVNKRPSTKGKASTYGRIVYCTLEVGDKTWRGEQTFVNEKRFNKKTARKIALSKALREAGLDRTDRAMVWANFWDCHKTNRQAAFDRFMRKNSWRFEDVDEGTTGVAYLNSLEKYEVI